MSEIFEFLARGGVIMIPIALGSVIALAIFLERIWSLQRGRVIPSGLARQEKAACRRRATGSLAAACCAICFLARRGRSGLCWL